MSNLQDFVIAYIETAGGIVDPPVYGVYETLLPEAAARQLGVAPLQRFAFGDEAPSGATRLSYGHSLVEQMVEAARESPACARFYANDVRLDKRGLAALAKQTFSLPNARLDAAPGATEGRALFHYLQVNFKAALITDEKREQLVSVRMDVQAGHAVEDLTPQTNLPLESEPRLPDLPVAPLAWLPGEELTSRKALAGLLKRAAQAAGRRLTDPIARLQARAARYLDLDRARLEEYYTDIEANLSRRLARTQDESRRATLQDKLAAARADHAAKLADVEAKYGLRVELEPINLALICQPKLRLQVRIGNRHASADRVVVWDPLRHVLEPLACEACRRATTTLLLCTSGHLTCGAPSCQAPQCVDCKRVYCRRCADRLTGCVVCDRPVCERSLNQCAACGRGTCREHVDLCHAAAGQPQRIEAAPPPSPGPDAEPEPPGAATPSRPRPEPAPQPPATVVPSRSRPAPTRSKRNRSRPARTRGKRERARSGSGPRSRPSVPRYSKLRLDVQLYPDEPVVAAFVYKGGGRQVARRTWSLENDGVVVFCDCEKAAACPADGMIFMPLPWPEVEGQLELEIDKLLAEYDIAPSRARFYLQTPGDNVKRVRRLSLPGPWRDEEKLCAAQTSFIATYVE